MYTRITRSGGRSYLQLVESYRVAGGSVRQRVIANLGRLDQLEPKDLDPLINGLNRALGRTRNEAFTPEYESAKAYGDVFLLHQLWHQLGFSKAIRKSLRSSKRTTDAEALVRLMVFNRLCAPDSKLGCLDWLETVSIPDMPAVVTHQHLLRTMDALIEHGTQIEKLMAEQLRPWLDQQLSVVFYDLTTIRIHGEARLDNDLRAHGMNKETGGIARQFVLGVVQSAEGIPLMHTVHPGNVAETKTLQSMLTQVLAQFPVERVILVADRGLLSVDNIAELTELADVKARQLQFILAVPARRYSELCDTFETLTWTDGLAESTFAGHRLVVAHDPVRAAEQTARRRERIQEQVDFAEALVNKLNAQDEGQSEPGRRASDRGAYSRFVRSVAEAELTRFIKADYNSELFSYWLDEKAIEKAERFDGKLVLVTNVQDFSAEEIVYRYKALADIERGFRVLKSDLEIAPVYHRLPERIEAHALICFMALVLYRVMRMRLRANGSTASPKTALERLRRIQQHKATVGAQEYTGISKATKAQLDLFAALEITPPKHPL
jgi:transposase